MSQSLPSTTFVIFGVSGDLSKRKLLPAMAEICQNSVIKTSLKIIGISRRLLLAEEVLPKQALNLVEQFEVFQMDYTEPDQYRILKTRLSELNSEQVIFYFAVPPESVLLIVKNLGEAGLNNNKFKLLMEKPFGVDFDSAKKLIKQIDKHFKQDQVYRIDHFLAKEMAQNIAVFLGSNAIFRDVWSSQFIDKIEIVAEESIGIEGRVHFYEQTGALRDIVQSHLLQLTALTLMEPCPDAFDFSMMRSHRLEAIKHLNVEPKSVIKAQYGGYKEEVNNPASNVETFVSLKLKSGAARWQGVPIQLVTGKKLKTKLTEIRIFFKKSRSSQSNMLRLRVQPKEGIEIDLWVKKPGYEQELQILPLGFAYQHHFDRLPDAYEQVIVDAIRSRASLFAGGDEVLASWQILQPLINKWDTYELGTYKPQSTVKQVLKNT